MRDIVDVKIENLQVKVGSALSDILKFILISVTNFLKMF